MTETPAPVPPAAPNEPKPSEDPRPGTLAAFLKDERLMPFVNYCLLFFMLMTYGMTGVIVLLIATFCIDKAPEWVQTHYRFQIRTFWICIVPVLIFTVIRLMIINSGSDDASLVFLLVLLPLLWIGGRASLGFNHLFHRRAHPNPKTLFI